MTPNIDSLHCSRTTAAIVSPVSDERAGRALGPDGTFRIERFHVSVAQDAVSYPGERRVWFRGHIGGGGNGEYAQFDPRTHLLARCMHFDTAESIEVSSASKPPSYVPRRSFVFATQHGVRIGSPLSKVFQVYGHVRPLHTAQGDVYAYERDIPFGKSSLPFVVRTVFLARNGRVVSVVRFQGV
jgi:hypothetical protein